MTRYISADYLFPIHQAPIKNGVIAMNDKQEVMGCFSPEEAILQGKTIEYHAGIITPGFVNAHCHLELSHLWKEIPKHSTLVPFLQGIMNRKPVEKAIMEQAMQEADRQMHDSGIVAVGDISNSLVSKAVKIASKLHYHTFVEVLGFDPKQVDSVLERGVSMKKSFLPLAASIVPHAPYSVSQELFQAIQKLSDTGPNLYSIHNQESDEENKLYQQKEGAFIAFYQALNRSIDFFKPKYRNSIVSILPNLPQKERILFVHNTFTSEEDIAFMNQPDLKATWCLCPNANLYIENTLPPVDILKKAKLHLVIGTDSLASNDTLCILSEIKTLHQYFPTLTLQETLTWATINGADFLGINLQFGSLEVGKKPGLNLISHINDLKPTAESTVKKLI